MNNWILVVDDEPDVIALFKQRFRKEIRSGLVSFKFASNGQQAIEVLRREDPPDVLLILSDINMPGINGFELLRTSRQNWPTLPVVMITAYGDDANRQQASELGAMEFVTKPIDFAALKAQLMKFIDAA